MLFKPFRQTRQRKRKFALNLRAVQRRIFRAWRALIFLSRALLDFGIQFRPALSQQLPDLPARKTLSARHMVEPGFVSRRQCPDGARGDFGGDGTAEFVAGEPHLFPQLPVLAHLVVDPAVAIW